MSNHHEGSPIVFLWYALFAAFIIWLVVRGAKKKRNVEEGHNALKSLAETRGWSYEKWDDNAIGELAGGPPFSSMEGPDGRHAVRGTHRNFPCRAFEYHDRGFPDGESGPETITVHSIWTVKVEQQLPHLRLFQKGFADRLFHGKSLQHDIPELDEKFHVVCEKGDEKDAIAILKGGLSEFLLTDKRADEISLRLYNDNLISWRTRAHLNAEELDDNFNFLADAAAHLPST